MKSRTPPYIILSIMLPIVPPKIIATKIFSALFFKKAFVTISINITSAANAEKTINAICIFSLEKILNAAPLLSVLSNQRKSPITLTASLPYKKCLDSRSTATTTAAKNKLITIINLQSNFITDTKKRQGLNLVLILKN